MSRKFIAASAAALAAFASFAATVPAHAETAKVFTGDLDLNSARGQAKLQARFNRAAHQICSYNITGTRIAINDQDCIAKARAGFETQVAQRRTESRNGG